MKWSEAHVPDLDSADWKGATRLGAGTFGAANLWYWTDANGTIADRIVAKDTWTGVRNQWVSEAKQYNSIAEVRRVADDT